MGFEIFMMISNLLIPASMLFFGLKFRERGPKEINQIYGYRTQMSMKNRETWEFAHRYCGAIWKKSGSLLLILSAIVSIFYLQFSDGVKAVITLSLITIQVVVLIRSIFSVEKALKMNFDEGGNRRN